MADQEFLNEDLDDEKTILFIKNYLPQELKEKFSDDELYYFLDLIDEYYTESGVLDAQPDADGCVEIDLDKVADFEKQFVQLLHAKYAEDVLAPIAAGKLDDDIKSKLTDAAGEIAAMYSK